MKSVIERNYIPARFTGNLLRWIVTREDGKRIYCETREDARNVARGLEDEAQAEDANALETLRPDLYADA